MPETSRKIGKLELPVTHIKFRFEDIEHDQVREFFDRFDIAYQKGGG